MPGPTTSDKAEDIGNNILTGIPGVGTVVNGYRVISDLATMAGGESTDPKQDHRDLASDALGMVPLLGTVMSIGGIAYDILASNDTSSNLTNQILGGQDKYAPDHSDDGPDAPPATSSSSGPQSTSSGDQSSSSGDQSTSSGDQSSSSGSQSTSANACSSDGDS